MSLKFKIGTLLRKHGIYINEATDENSLMKLLLKLKPINCGIELIRLGGNFDGGYLIPDDLEGVEFCFSPGVDVIANFENDCLKKGIRSFLADYSVEAPPISLQGCQFIKKYVGAYNDSQTITMENWILQSLPKDFNGDLILQMDIEGAEYETLISMPASILKMFRILVLEIHNFQRLANKEYYKLINATFEKIAEYFAPVHLHVNNHSQLINVNGVSVPPIFEMTFLRKDRMKTTDRFTSLPHPLDQPNYTDKIDTPLPPVWAK